MAADYSFYLKFIAIFALTFFGYIISVLAFVQPLLHKKAGVAIVSYFAIKTAKITFSCYGEINFIWLHF